MTTIDEVRQRHESALLALPGVVGLSAETIDGQALLQVLVSRKLPEHDEVIPQRIEGFPVQVVEVGEPTAPPTT